MDTIIYVYCDRSYSEENSRGYCRRDYDMGDYRLVRVGVSKELWRILQEREPENAGSEREENRALEQRGWFKRLSGKLPWNRLKEQLRTQRSLRLRETVRQQRLAAEAERRQQFVAEIMEDRDHSYFVTQEPIAFLEGWSFRGYAEEEWVLHLMQYASGNHFVILGKADCIPRLLLRYVKHMKSLKWWITGRQFGEAEQE